MSISACKNYGTFSKPYRVIATGPGPEDIALDTSLGFPRIIISSTERRLEDSSRNGFYAYTISTGKQIRLTIVGLPDSLQLRPHGIDVAQIGNQTFLYAVNHDSKRDLHGILVFQLQENSLQFVNGLYNPLVTSPNDVCTDHRGGLYVSNDSGKKGSTWEKLWALKRSYVMHFDGTIWKQVGDKLAYANGVGVVGNRLYVTGTQEKTIHFYTIEPSGLTNRVDLPAIKGADNITFSCGKLITAAHLDFIKFIGHVKKSEKKSPSMVYSVDMKTQKLDTLFLDNGNVLSASSTGLIVGDSLYVSQVFDPFIVAVPLRK